MGHCRKILGFRIIEPTATLYSGLLAIELAENFHIHIRNLRLELDHVEFERLAIGFAKALEVWRAAGRPHTQGYERLGDRLLNLHRSEISPLPSLWNAHTANDELRVELQQWADYIHLHYRNVKLEFTVKEFVEFADTVGRAREQLIEELNTTYNPARLGKFHRANPSGRVSSGETDYWTRPPDWEQVSAKPYASNYLDEEDLKRKFRRSRHTADPTLMYADISDLYCTTLYHAGELHPWMVDETGICLPLAARYAFVKMALEAKGLPTQDQIHRSEYWRLLGRSLGSVPRDGSREWVYADPEAQCQRFLDLIRSVMKNGYGNMVDDREFGLFDSDHPVMVNHLGTVRPLGRKPSPHLYLLTVRPIRGAYCVWNGLHRIAILKCLWDAGLLDDNRILVHKTDDRAFGPHDFPELRPQVQGLRAAIVSTLVRFPIVRQLGLVALSRFPALRRLLPVAD